MKEDRYKFKGNLKNQANAWFFNPERPKGVLSEDNAKDLSR